jgi:transposase, IS30 family
MSKNYKQLSLDQRYQIEALIKAGMRQKDIAFKIGVHPSTISREMKRNIACRGRTASEYVATNAQRKTCHRHKSKPKQSKFSQAMKTRIVHLLNVEKWSPELISKCSGCPMVSHERIYQWIWECKLTNTQQTRPYRKLYELLKHGRRRRKRGNRKDSRGIIVNRTPIEKRPAVVNKRNRLGDLEVDLMMGKNHQGAILVITDRASLHTRLTLLPNKESESVYKGTMNCIKRNNYQAKTLTFDNDLAFSCHEMISQNVGAKSYFTRPYTSQDKGTVENRIGLLRRFFPKKTNLNFVTEKQVREVERKINSRPIRKFNYLTANQVLLKKIAVIT